MKWDNTLRPSYAHGSVYNFVLSNKEHYFFSWSLTLTVLYRLFISDLWSYPASLLDECTSPATGLSLNLWWNGAFK